MINFKNVILCAAFPVALTPSGAIARTLEENIAPAETAQFHKALSLTPDINNGRELYRSCATCHGPEGWGRFGGDYPQISGQLHEVVIKQLLDIREGNRGNPMMRPFVDERILPNAQSIADVAAYISQLPMTRDNDRGPGIDLARGKDLYDKNCVDCHGKNGEGNDKEAIPLIQGQHFAYLVRQFRWIQIGRRKNSDPDMVDQIQNFHAGDTTDIMDYVSRLTPPESKLAKPGWTNPDFPHYDHGRFRYTDVESSTTPEERNFEDKKNKEEPN